MSPLIFSVISLIIATYYSIKLNLNNYVKKDFLHSIISVFVTEIIPCANNIQILPNVTCYYYYQKTVKKQKSVAYNTYHVIPNIVHTR